MKLEFSWQILEQILNLMKICPVWGELLHAGGRTDKKKLIVSFFNFSKEPINPLISSAVSNFTLPKKFSYKNSASLPCLSFLCICVALTRRMFSWKKVKN